MQAACIAKIPGWAYETCTITLAQSEACPTQFVQALVDEKIGSTTPTAKPDSVPSIGMALPLVIQSLCLSIVNRKINSGTRRNHASPPQRTSMRSLAMRYCIRMTVERSHLQCVVAVACVHRPTTRQMLCETRAQESLCRYPVCALDYGLA